MFLYNFILILIGVLTPIHARDDSTKLKDLFYGVSFKDLMANFYLVDDETAYPRQDKVKIQVYYETLCPGSKYFVSDVLTSTVLKLSQFLDIFLYPCGGVKTTEKDGHYEFECQHGPLECYGNKLHACAIDILYNMTTSVAFNGCLMEGNQGSDDLTADKCGKRLNIDSAPIKECAKSERGSKLLKLYSEETHKANVRYVPYTLINNKVYSSTNFRKEVCDAFVFPPPACNTEKFNELTDWNEEDWDKDEE